MPTPTCSPERRARVGVLGPLAGLALGAVCAQAPASAQDSELRESVFRVCQDPNNLPFSNVRGEGFENRIAELFAAKLGWKVTYYDFPQRLGFIRNTLRFKLPGEDYACDIVMGVPARYDQAAPTRPYYHSTYALVLGARLQEVKSVRALLDLPAEQRSKLRIGVYDRTPGSDWLVRNGLLDQAVPYRILNADPDQYPGQIIEKDLAAGKLDAAVVWGPIAGYFVKRLPDAGLSLIPLASQPGVKLDFEIAMGVRPADQQWKATLDRLIAENRGQIDAILRQYNVPLVDADGKLVQ